MVTVDVSGAGRDDPVNQLLSRYVHKLNNAMLPFLLELDDLMVKMDEYSRVDQLKLQRFEQECKAQIEMVQRIRSLISSCSESDFE